MRRAIMKAQSKELKKQIKILHELKDLIKQGAPTTWGTTSVANDALRNIPAANQTLLDFMNLYIEIKKRKSISPKDKSSRIQRIQQFFNEENQKTEFKQMLVSILEAEKQTDERIENNTIESLDNLIESLLEDLNKHTKSTVVASNLPKSDLQTDVQTDEIDDSDPTQDFLPGPNRLSKQ